MTGTKKIKKDQPFETKKEAMEAAASIAEEHKDEELLFFFPVRLDGRVVLEVFAKIDI